jgi:hypothetical protein
MQWRGYLCLDDLAFVRQGLDDISLRHTMWLEYECLETASRSVILRHTNQTEAHLLLSILQGLQYRLATASEGLIASCINTTSAYSNNSLVIPHIL